MHPLMWPQVSGMGGPPEKKNMMEHLNKLLFKKFKNDLFSLLLFYVSHHLYAGIYYSSMQINEEG